MLAKTYRVPLGLVYGDFTFRVTCLVICFEPRESKGEWPQRQTDFQDDFCTFLLTLMAPHGNTKDEGSSEPAPISPGGSYTIQVSSLATMLGIATCKSLMPLTDCLCRLQAVYSPPES